ncbi:hypothetical protein FN846DRAFT_953375 [Sphaerosporella brunnea]|uniref:Uncharacterized protein n=1 Tax=Sphaerosporella brunnea TaxID=1250544 RepID=A0A5J5ETU6_9PEZI|nr:hypothetical protein FN846DRAFT_953375 [Sphaerosporella brunnea]
MAKTSGHSLIFASRVKSQTLELLLLWPGFGEQCASQQAAENGAAVPSLPSLLFSSLLSFHQTPTLNGINPTASSMIGGISHSKAKQQDFCVRYGGPIPRSSKSPCRREQPLHRRSFSTAPSPDDPSTDRYSRTGRNLLGNERPRLHARGRSQLLTPRLSR